MVLLQKPCSICNRIKVHLVTQIGASAVNRTVFGSTAAGAAATAQARPAAYAVIRGILAVVAKAAAGRPP